MIYAPTVVVMVTWLAVTAPTASLSMPPTPLAWGTGPLTVDALPRITHVAHRGGAREVPENSMAGLTAAYARGTAQVLDFDTRALRDGTPVVFHDPTLDRTTHRSGAVRTLDSHGWRAVRLRPAPSLPGRWRPERPPTVAEVLDRFGGPILLMLEVKDPGSLDRLAALIRGRDLARSVLVKTNDPAVARRAEALGLLSQLWRSARQLRTDRPARWRSYVDVLDGPPRPGRGSAAGGAVRDPPGVGAHGGDPGPAGPGAGAGLRRGDHGRAGAAQRGASPLRA